MTPFLEGFGDELTKLAAGLGALKSVGKFTMKHPLIALGAGTTGIATAAAYREAKKRGLQEGQRPRYLAAGVDPVSGQAYGSGAERVNWHHLFPHKPSAKSVRALSANYDEKKFK